MTTPLEFKVLLQQALRKGTLELEAFLASYTAMQPRYHQKIADNRVLDIAAVLYVLKQLPPQFILAKKIQVVAHLEAFDCLPIFSFGFKAGFVAGETLLVEVSPESIYAFVLALCTLQFEWQKAKQLLQAEHPLSFALGVDDETLQEANTETLGAFFTWLHKAEPLAPIFLHPELQPNKQSAKKIIQELAEMGLIDRPLYLFIGPKLFTDCLSPYGRDLSESLLLWAEQNQHPDVQELTEDTIYSVLPDFLATDERLLEEQQQVDRSVGIFHHPNYEFIDLGRIDTTACDQRLPPFQFSNIPPVVLRCDTSIPAEILEELFSMLGTQIIGATFVLYGSEIPKPLGSILQLNLLIDYHSQEKISPMQGPSLNLPQAFKAGVLCAPTVNLYHEECFADYNVQGCIVYDFKQLTALRDAVFKQELPVIQFVNWAIVHAEESTAKLSMPVIAACTALSIECLKQLSASPEKSQHPKPPLPKNIKTAASGLREPSVKRKIHIKV